VISENQEQYLVNVRKFYPKRKTMDTSVLWQVTQESNPGDLIKGKSKKNNAYVVKKLVWCTKAPT